MEKMKKLLVFIMILVSFNLTKLSVEVNAAGRLGINLFSNPGFERGDKFNFAPFIVKYNSNSLANVFAKGEIVDGVGVGGSRALEAELMPTCSGNIYGTFNVNPRSTYRLSAAGRRTESDDNPMHIGVRNYDETITNSEAISGKFDSLEYQYKHVDFIVGKETGKVEIFIYYPKPSAFYQTGGYIDDLVIEEVSYPPTINPVYDPTIADSISGTAEPGMTVKITLPGDKEETLQVKEDGTFSLPITLGSLNDGDIITAVQYGLYGVASAPEESIVAEKRLGKNLFQNPGFELPDNFNFAPFIIKYNSDNLANVFQIGEIRDGIGSIDSKDPAKDRGLYLRLMLMCTGTVPGVFSVNSRSNYRVSAEGRRKDTDDGNGYIGVKGFNAANTNKTSATFDALQYKYRYADFLVEDNIREVETYIYIPHSKAFYQPDLYIDNFILEETAFPPEINEVNDASATTKITGVSDPGTVVEATVISGNSPSYTGVTGYDGNYSITIPSGVINHGVKVEVRQHGLYGTISQPNSIVTRDTVAPPAPSINIVRDKDTVLTGRSEPYSIVTIWFESGDSEEIVAADALGNYSISLTTKTLKAGESIYATAKDKDDNTSGTTTTKIIDTANTTVDLDKGIAIYGENFRLNVGDVQNLTEEIVLEKSNARAFKIDDEDSKLNIEVNSSVFRDEIGVYPVFLNVEDVSRCIYVSVVDSENSAIDSEKNIVIYAKDFSVKETDVAGLDIAQYSELKAWNLSSGEDLTKSVIISAPLLEAKEGTYDVEFRLETEMGTVIHTVKATVLDVDIIKPEIYGYEIISPFQYTGSSWSNKDIVLKLFARDNVKVNHNTYEIYTGSGDIWTTVGFSNQTSESAILTISSEGYKQNILVRVSDTTGNISDVYDIGEKLKINIDKTLPSCNIESRLYSFEELGKITFEDDLSGISTAKLNGEEITSGFDIPEEKGEQILVIIDNAGNMLKINFIVESIDTGVSIEGVMVSDGAKVSTIKRDAELISETSVILKNLDTKKEYMGFLKYGEPLLFKEIEYGEYEIFWVNPADIKLINTSVPSNKFIINQQTRSTGVTIKSEFIKLNGFGNIREINNTSENIQ